MPLRVTFFCEFDSSTERRKYTMHELRTKFHVTALIPFGVAASCCLGILTHCTMQNGDFMAAIFKAFTIQSNIWAGSIALLGLGFSWFNKNKSTCLAGLFVLCLHLNHADWLDICDSFDTNMSVRYLLSQSNSICIAYPPF
jgi:hypothetical protein